MQGLTIEALITLSPLFGVAVPTNLSGTAVVLAFAAVCGLSIGLAAWSLRRQFVITP